VTVQKEICHPLHRLKIAVRKEQTASFETTNANQDSKVLSSRNIDVYRHILGWQRTWR